MTTIPPNPEEALVTISTPQSDTVRVRDRVESSRFEFYFDDCVEIEEVTTDALYFPVDIAAKLRGSWTELTVPMAVGAHVHNPSTGNVIRRVSRDDPSARLEPGRYEIEVMPAPMKIYLQVDDEIALQLRDEKIFLKTDSNTEIIAGLRSLHKQPAGTIKTTTDPREVMRAVSLLGSALKTTSPERSWPTLRGYPPKIVIGDEFSSPESISRPDVDVVLEIPNELEAIFQIAPLAYYVAAEVVPLPSESERPALVAAGERIILEGDLGIAASSLLQKNVLVDSVVRSEGLFSFPTFERETLESELPWRIADVYNLPLAERILAYESVEKDAIDRLFEQWPLTIDVAGEQRDIPAIPHIAEELAVVRVPKINSSSPDPQPQYVTDFVRADGSGTISRAGTASERREQTPVVRPKPWNTQIHTSLLENYPLGSNKTSIRSFERHIEREAPDTNVIKVNVVCNDNEMREEDVVSEYYGVRDLLEFDVNIQYNLTKAEFTDLLTESFDLIHYIGHVDGQGIQCKDGYIDARTDIGTVGFDAFLLNACRSVEQGEALLDAGAAGGIATLYDVPNSSATIIGRTLSRLLNRGFTIRSAMEIARDASYLSDRWVSLGDGRVSLTQAESVTPSLLSVTPQDDAFELKLEWFETSSHRIGTLVWPNTEWGMNYVLPSDVTKTVTERQLEELFSLEVAPVKVGSDLYWTDELAPADIPELYDDLSD